MVEKYLDNPLLGRLLDVGYMSVNVGLVDQADYILRNLAALRPDRIEASLGMALLAWRMEGTDAALVLLQQLRDRHGDEPALLTFSVMVLAASDRHAEAIELARQLIGSKDMQVRNFARGLLRDLTATMSGETAGA